MAYKLKFKTKDEVPEEFQEFAKEVEEGDAKVWVINVEPAARVKDFRDRNVEQSKKIETLESVVEKIKPLLGEDGEVDPLLTEVTELRGLKQQVDDGKITAKTDIEAEVTKRTEAMRSAHNETVQALKAENSQLKTAKAESDSKYKMAVLDNAVSIAASDTAIGANPKALPHLINAARSVFEIGDDGKMTAKDAGGNTRWGEDGSTPMTITEWLKEMKTTDPFFFLPSNGGGAGGGADSDIKGMSAAELAKLSPMEKLRLANRQS